MSCNYSNTMPVLSDWNWNCYFCSICFDLLFWNIFLNHHLPPVYIFSSPFWNCQSIFSPKEDTISERRQIFPGISYVGARWLFTFRILWRYKTKFTKNTRRKNEYHLIWTEKLLLICYMLPPLERFANFWSKTKISGESNCFLLADNIYFCHNVFLEHK